MADKINPNTIMEEEDEDQYSTQNNNPASKENDYRKHYTNLFNVLVNNQNLAKDIYSTTSYNNIQTGSIVYNDFEAGNQQNNYQAQDQQPSLEFEHQLQTPQFVKDLLQCDESLYDLMRHKNRFKFQFGKEFFLVSQKVSQSQNQENRIQAEYDMLEKNYECFNGFFFQKQQLQERSVLEIHHSQSTEKTQLLSFMISEILRDQACKDVQEQSQIAPEILLYDNTQQFNYKQIKQMIKNKLFQIHNLKQNQSQSQDFHAQSQANSQSLETLFETISENCLQKLHVIESHSQIEFCVNLRAMKHILTKNKSIRIVIIDEINAFYVENDSYAHHHKTPSKDEDESNNQKKKKKITGQHHVQHKLNVNKQFDTLIKEYLDEVQQKFTRVSFIQSRRDYFKVRNLIDFQEDRFLAKEELTQILSREMYHQNIDFQNIYCLTLDNFSVLAIEKALELIKQDQISSQIYVNPQKVSIVVKKNLNSYQEDDEDQNDQENIKMQEFKYQMGFYTFDKGEFKIFSENLFYIN
ncbi:hypothetical protein ABPG74_019356 [Tetrahymena malaccensis]